MGDDIMNKTFTTFFGLLLIGGAGYLLYRKYSKQPTGAYNLSPSIVANQTNNANNKQATQKFVIDYADWDGIKKAKNQPKGAINIEYMSYEEIKKQIDLNNRVQIPDNHTDISVGKSKIGYYVAFTHYGIAQKGIVTVHYITSDTYMKLRTEDGIPVEDVAVSGIGDVPVWNKGHIRNWLGYDHYGYPEKIVVYRDRPYYVNEGCVEVESYIYRDSRWPYRNFSIREKDIDYLRMLCQEYRVEFIEL